MSETVPKGWQKKKLGKFGKFSTSSVDKKINPNEQSVYLLNYMDIYRNSILDESHPFQSVTAPQKQISSSNVVSGDVFFTPSSETPDDIGHSGVFIGDIKNLVHSYHTIRYRTHSPNVLDNRFKAYAFKSNNTYAYFRKAATGSTRFTISLPVFEELEVLIPPLPEQKKIASILTSVDEVIENTQKQIDKLQDLKKATMNELLTKGIGHKEFKDSELGRIPKNWEVVRLRNLGTCVRGLTYSPDDVEQSGLLVLRSSNIKNGELAFDDNVFVSLEVENHFLTCDGDILICVRNGSRSLLGKSAYIEGNSPKSTHGAFMTVFRGNLNWYIRYLIESPSFFTQVSRDIGATINSINNSNLLDYRFAIPSDQLEMKYIANTLKSISEKVRVERIKLQQTHSLKKALMQDLLTGKARVKVN